MSVVGSGLVWFNLLMLATLAYPLLCLGRHIRRLSSQGIAAFRPDWTRTPPQMLSDAFQFLCLLAFAWLVLVFGLGGVPGHLPPWLAAIILDRPGAKASGLVIMVAADLFYRRSLDDLGESFRLCIDHQHHGGLKTGGVYRWSRNPIYLCIMAWHIGVFLVQGRLVFLVLAVAQALLFHRLIAREEAFLLKAFGADYQAYCEQVRRWL